MPLKARAGLVCGALVVIGAVGIYLWTQGAPRREALASLARLDSALHSGGRTGLLDLLVLPAALQGRSAAEQSEFLAKALNDEISPEGLAVLRKHGEYGPLTNLFPAAAEAWAREAGVNPDECVAFKLERPGLRAEVVLARGQRSEVRLSTASCASTTSSHWPNPSPVQPRRKCHEHKLNPQRSADTLSALDGRNRGEAENQGTAQFGRTSKAGWKPAGQRSTDIPVRIGGTPPAQADQIVRAPAAFRLLPADL